MAIFQDPEEAIHLYERERLYRRERVYRKLLYKKYCFTCAELDKKTFVYMVVEKIEKGKYRSDQDSLCHQLHRKEWT